MAAVTATRNEWAVGKNRWGDQLRTAHLMDSFSDGWGAACGTRLYAMTGPVASARDTGAQPCARCLKVLKRRQT